MIQGWALAAGQSIYGHCHPQASTGSLGTSISYLVYGAGDAPEELS